MGKTLVKIPPTYHSQDAGGNHNHERLRCERCEERPPKEGPAVFEGVEHDGPGCDVNKIQNKECRHQFLHLPTDSEPPLHEEKVGQLGPCSTDGMKIICHWNPRDEELFVIRENTEE